MKNSGSSIFLSVFLAVAVAQVTQFAFSRIDSAGVRLPAATRATDPDRGGPLPAGCESALSTRQCFSAATAHWSTVCRENPILQKDPFFAVRLRDFAEETLFIGLERLVRVNPLLVEQVLKRLPEPMTLRCENFDESVRPGFWGSLFARPPRVVGRFLRLDQAAEAVACAYGALCREATVPVEGYRNPIFQEFLRQYGLDNIPRHGADPEANSADVPSVCASTVYPSERFPLGPEVCATCALASPKRRGMTVLSADPARKSAADQACGAFQVTRSP